MKAIVTIQNNDGTFSECGMNTRTFLGPYVRKSFIQKQAREYAKGKPHRIEYFPSSSIQGNPIATDYVT